MKFYASRLLACFVFKSSVSKRSSCSVSTLSLRHEKADIGSAVQGGESRVMSLADEVEARTVELKGIQQQVQEARTLNQRLRARLTTKEPVTAREATAAV